MLTIGHRQRVPTIRLMTLVRLLTRKSLRTTSGSADARRRLCTSLAIPDEIRKSWIVLQQVLPVHVFQSLKSAGLTTNTQVTRLVLDVGRSPRVYCFGSSEEKRLSGTISRSDLQVMSHSDLLTPWIGAYCGIRGTLHNLIKIRGPPGDADIVGLTLRLGHGRAVSPLPASFQNHLRRKKSLLVIGTSGSGKTSLLREASRVLADEHHQQVLIVDTLGEVAGCDAEPHPSAGCLARRVFVEHLVEQPASIDLAVRMHVPQYLVIDELRDRSDIMSAVAAHLAGVTILAGYTARSVESWSTFAQKQFSGVLYNHIHQNFEYVQASGPSFRCVSASLSDIADERQVVGKPSVKETTAKKPSKAKQAKIKQGEGKGADHKSTSTTLSFDEILSLAKQGKTIHGENKEPLAHAIAALLMNASNGPEEDEKMVLNLLRAGVDINTRCTQGRTCLHKLVGLYIERSVEIQTKSALKVFRKHAKSVAETLIESGADPALQDEQGRPPLEMLKKNDVLFPVMLRTPRDPFGPKTIFD